MLNFTISKSKIINKNCLKLNKSSNSESPKSTATIIMIKILKTILKILAPSKINNFQVRKANYKMLLRFQSVQLVKRRTYRIKIK